MYGQPATTEQLIYEIQQFLALLKKAPSTQRLEHAYFQLVHKIQTSIYDLEQLINSVQNKNWRNYIESWVGYFLTFSPSDPMLVNLKAHRKEQHALLHCVLQGEARALYQETLTSREQLIFLAHHNREAFIRYIFDKNKELNAFELGLFLPTSIDILKAPTTKRQKDLNRLKSSTYLCLSNLIIARDYLCHYSDLASWLSTIAKSYLFWTYDLEPLTYSYTELLYLNNLVINWLSMYEDKILDERFSNEAFNQLIRAKTRFKTSQKPIKNTSSATFYSTFFHNANSFRQDLAPNSNINNLKF